MNRVGLALLGLPHIWYTHFIPSNHKFTGVAMNLKPLIASISPFIGIRSLELVPVEESPYMWSSSSGSPKKVVRVERRRRAEPPASGRERAETPQRRDSEEAGSPPSYSSPPSGGTPPSSGGGLQSLFPSGGGSGRPLGGKQMILVFVLVLVVVCIFGGTQLFGGGGTESPTYDQPAVGLEPTEQYEILPLDTPTQRPRPTATTPSALRLQALRLLPENPGR